MMWSRWQMCHWKHHNRSCIFWQGLHWVHYQTLYKGLREGVMPCKAIHGLNNAWIKPSYVFGMAHREQLPICLTLLYLHSDLKGNHYLCSGGEQKVCLMLWGKNVFIFYLNPAFYKSISFSLMWHELSENIVVLAMEMWLFFLPCTEGINGGGGGLQDWKATMILNSAWGLWSAAKSGHAKQQATGMQIIWNAKQEWS